VTAKNLDLREFSLLSGRQLPVKGDLTMNLTAEGTLNNIKTDGKLQLKKAQVTLGEEQPDVIGVDAEITLDGQQMQIEKSQAKYNAREFGIDGTIDFKNMRDPAFDVGLRMKGVTFPLRDDASIDTDLNLKLGGTYGDALVSGTANVLDLKLAPGVQVAGLFTGAKDLRLHPALPIDATQPPVANWRFDVALDTPQPAKVLWQQGGASPDAAPKYATNGSMTVNASAIGKGPAIVITGKADFQDWAADYYENSGPITESSRGIPLTLRVEKGTTLYLSGDAPVWYAAAISAKATKENITGWIFGSDNDISSIYFSDQPRSEQEIRPFLIRSSPLTPSLRRWS
jgi:hypothetical protein